MCKAAYLQATTLTGNEIFGAFTFLTEPYTSLFHRIPLGSSTASYNHTKQVKIKNQTTKYIHKAQ